MVQMQPRLYFGRQVAVTDRSVIHRYALPERAYLGPTSMDTEMAFVICNQAQVPYACIALDMTGSMHCTVQGSCMGIKSCSQLSGEWVQHTTAATSVTCRLCHSKPIS